MMQSEQIDQLATALAAAQGAMKSAAFNRTNPHFKSKYADLASIWDAIRGPLSSQGLSVTQQSVANGDGYILLTVLRHSSGQWCSSQYPLPVGLKAQDLGAYRTYLRRYELSAIVGIAGDADDDDGNVAQALEVEVKPLKGPLSEQQALTIRQALEVRNMHPDRLLKYVTANTKTEISRVEDIPAAMYEKCLARIETALT